VCDSQDKYKLNKYDQYVTEAKYKLD